MGLLSDWFQNCRSERWYVERTWGFRLTGFKTAVLREGTWSAHGLSRGRRCHLELKGLAQGMTE